MEQIVVVVLPFVVGISVAVFMLVWQSGYILIDFQRANPAGTGPMTRSTASKQVVYRAVIATTDGERRTALVRIGSPSAGVLSKELSVERQDGLS